MSGPPAVPFALTVGITGHRAEALPAAAAVEARVAAVLERLERAAFDLLKREAALFAAEPPCLTLVSPLASGADQLAARIAVERGWALQAVLPLPRQSYAASMDPAGAAELQRLLEAATCVLELPGDPANPTDSFVMAGRATVAHSDLLLAVWDGLPARGRGGTAETVDLALLRGTPILHLPIESDQPSRLLWSGFDPVVISAPGDHHCGRPDEEAELHRVLAALLAPPPNPRERQFIQRYLVERERKLRLRLEYPLLMTLAGAHRISRKDVNARLGVEAARNEWLEYRQRCAGCHGVDAPLDALQQAYEWSDRLATHFAQTYRSSHVFNFLLAALGALIGLSGLVFQGNPFELAIAEFAVVLAVIVNTQTGSSSCWHQRWLDYRQLAERLRPMRSLKLLGLAAPDPPGSPAEPIARRWIDWYAAAMWRTIGCPGGRLQPADVPRLAEAIAERELEPQIAYNRRTGAQMAAFDQRLEWVALAIFGTTLAITFATILCLLFAPQLLKSAGNWTTVLSAGLPAVGTAIFGIRVQGDYGALSARSRHTADQLQRIATDLTRARDLPRTADLTEQAARVMLADLGEWRLVNELHELSLG
ncbi:DUF4231 domain-containing protein [Sphingomonas sp. BN140010]|uniref:DUF4231 domain-containing protein n=1 Tax=Sphingomonas arvum TaxID=2992113 RepID=A0ABT3JEZ8_9SPHN|nr:DUF4231 domain-containing protein [Sphingomonas sp. BN140010]MCW3797648.1 DUF4231 domain-containing protein [Sphingomonas sp. BN140010]